jgi:hypothetical protein
MLKKLGTICFLITLFTFSAYASGQEPILKKGMFPTYPPCAIEKRVQGTVRIKAVLNSDGRLGRAILIGKMGEELSFPELKNDAQFAYQCLCQAAQKASSTWEFEKGSKVKEVILSFHFELVDGIPFGEGLYPLYIAPLEVHIRGLLPNMILESGAKKGSTG